MAKMVLLPPPEGPHSPTESPFSTLKVMLFKTTTSFLKGYANATASNSTCPSFDATGTLPCGDSPSISDFRSSSWKRSWQANFVLLTSPRKEAEVPRPIAPNKIHVMDVMASPKSFVPFAIISPAHQNPNPNTKKVTACDTPKLNPPSTALLTPARTTFSCRRSTSPTRLASAPADRRVRTLLHASDITWVTIFISSPSLLDPIMVACMATAWAAAVTGKDRRIMPATRQDFQNPTPRPTPSAPSTPAYAPRPDIILPALKA
mmetsp:Transcript_79268/g.212007  ORF Transcript_79268/g.212007 Transcript_79268/m.212007 type:complete len:262 (-) Transcript_79268:2451-3236(-)